MKKIIIALFLVFVFMTTANAEQCIVVNGTGKDIGDEIVCGTEHFYVMEHNDNETKMLAKYNLNVGDKIDYFEVTDSTAEYFNDNQLVNSETNTCRNYASLKGYNPYFVYPMGEEKESGIIKLVGCRVYEVMNEEHTRQDPRAIGTKIVNGKSVLPLYGITYMEPKWGYEAMVNHNIQTISYDSDGNLIIKNTLFEKYLNDYKSELKHQGYDTEDISFVTLNRMLSFLKNISGKDVAVNLEYPTNASGQLVDEDYYIGKMDIKEFINEKNNWAYSTTYWLGSGYEEENDLSVDFRDYYISNEGFLCALGRGNCVYLPYPIGNGVRPLVTMLNSNILKPYLITTKTDGKGSIEVTPNAHENDIVTLRVVSKANYTISSLRVTDKSGNEVKTTKKEVIEGKEETVTVYEFKMPAQDVKVEAEFTLNIANPNTGYILPYLTLFILLTMGVGALIIANKKIINNIK